MVISLTFVSGFKLPALIKLNACRASSIFA
jgi:hypothetical protein